MFTAMCGRAYLEDQTVCIVKRRVLARQKLCGKITTAFCIFDSIKVLLRVQSAGVETQPGYWAASSN